MYLIKFAYSTVDQCQTENQSVEGCNRATNVSEILTLCLKI